MTPNGSTVVVRIADGSEVDITESVQVMYDVIISSMDWGSGFLSVEEAVPVVHVAETCGFAKYEDAQRYVDELRHSSEQERFIAERGLDYRYGFPYGRPPLEHDHVMSSAGRCMWPGCRERDGR
jgi:hypothetical protein